MPQAYAQHVNGFRIGPQSLACGLAAGTGQPIITRDVIEEPLWKPWLWLAEEFEYRACWSFPVESSMERSSTLSRCITKIHAKRHSETLISPQR
jgi:hypothetical protein